MIDRESLNEPRAESPCELSCGEQPGMPQVPIVPFAVRAHDEQSKKSAARRPSWLNPSATRWPKGLTWCCSKNLNGCAAMAWQGPRGSTGQVCKEKASGSLRSLRRLKASFFCPKQLMLNSKNGQTPMHSGRRGSAVRLTDLGLPMSNRARWIWP